MNWSEQLLAGVAVDLLALGILALLTGIIWLAGRRLLMALTRMKTLEREVAVYSEASTRVAETVEDILLARVKPGESVHSSRRYLLGQARDRLARGEPLQATARSLGLSFDELRLLQRSAVVRSPDNVRIHHAVTDAGVPAP